MKLETPYKTYNVEVINGKYENGRTYLGLIDKKTKETIVDITENHVEISDNELQFNCGEGMERAVIDGDFINCFEDVRNAKIRLMDNLHCLGGDFIDGRPCIVILPQTIIGKNINDF